MKQQKIVLTVISVAVMLLTASVISGQKKLPVTDGADRMVRFDQHMKMKVSSSFKDLKWQLIGPLNISGRCTDIEVVGPKGSNYTIYAGSASGGVWKTENEGTTWVPIFDQHASTSTGDIAIDPNDPNTLWVGTGEANIFRSSQNGAGVYKTTDGGKTWRHMGLENTHTIARIVVDPDNTDIVYVSATGHEWTRNRDRGIYKTVDGGANWEKILYVDDLAGSNDLVMDPTDSQILYATTWQRIRKKWNDPRVEPGYTKSGIYKTTDGGQNWVEINTGLPEAKYRGRIGIDIARSNPDILYALVDNYEIARQYEGQNTDSYGRPIGGVIKGATIYRTDNRGADWIQVSGLTEEMQTYMERHSSTYGWVFGQIRVDPNDENTVYSMGLALNVSNDGGKTFRRLRGMHVDHHGLWIDPDNSDYLVNANDGGISISYDRGLNWRSFTDNFPLVQFFNISYDMSDPFYVYGSVQDHGSYRG
ncbi:MAG: hypothetical protein JSV24_03295, partial [Bacteroidales bacterium]